MKNIKLVTKQSMVELLARPNKQFVETVIGRAIAGLYARQTAEEQNNHNTKTANGVGFTSFDADVGSRTAEYWKNTGKLEPWMVRYWTKLSSAGFPSLSRYHRQLNDIALEKMK